MSILLFGAGPGEVSAEQIEAMRSLAPDMQILVSKDRGEIEAALPDIEIAARRFPHDLLPNATNLRWLQQWGAGADWLMRYPEAAEMDFVLTNASGVHPIPIGEHIFALLLAFARQVHLAVRAQSQGQWRRPAHDSGELLPPFELYGKTMLLVGVGAIGQRTAQLADAFKMRVIGVRRSAEHGESHRPTAHPIVPYVDMMVGPEQLVELLPEADFVVLTVPATHETMGLFGEREFKAMKETAYLVNIGRGGTIDERALVKALQAGWIAGAGLDVFETEPLPADSPLWKLENVIITAHYAGSTPHYEERAMAIFLDNLRRYRAGQALNNVVDKTLGY
ncbi:MAG: D-2-hydroxyacid dehydrogenase [Anaerolineae bacterium]|nr:D-2-hydroxyacid dehydrogenase [Anaerolineae bacterium]